MLLDGKVGDDEPTILGGLSAQLGPVDLAYESRRKRRGYNIMEFAREGLGQRLDEYIHAWQNLVKEILKWSLLCVAKIDLKSKKDPKYIYGA